MAHSIDADHKDRGSVSIHRFVANLYFSCKPVTDYSSLLVYIILFTNDYERLI